jgi:hypothetical protein
MTPKRRIRKLAALVGTTPETLTEVIGDALRDTINELQIRKPKADRRIARRLRRRRKKNADVWTPVARQWH